MVKWIPCGEDFITGDVVRWQEAVWKPKKRKTDKSVRIGTRRIVAQAEICGPEWTDVKVISSETEIVDGWTVDKLKPGECLRRRRGPIAKGGAERRLWSDESARAIIASKFLNSTEAAETRPGPQAKMAYAGETRGARRTGGGRRGYGKGRRKIQLRP